VGWWVAPLAVAVAVGAMAVAAIAQRAFGGISGDILGAVEQIGECLILIVVSGLAERHSVWWV
jgi:adenosylcobinamide-GDP ribazoletransferase